MPLRNYALIHYNKYYYYFSKCKCIDITIGSVNIILIVTAVVILLLLIEVLLLEQYWKDTCHVMLDLMLKLSVQRAVCDSSNSSF